MCIKIFLLFHRLFISIVHLYYFSVCFNQGVFGKESQLSMAFPEQIKAKIIICIDRQVALCRKQAPHQVRIALSAVFVVDCVVSGAQYLLNFMFFCRIQRVISEQLLTSLGHVCTLRNSRSLTSKMAFQYPPVYRDEAVVRAPTPGYWLA